MCVWYLTFKWVKLGTDLLCHLGQVCSPNYRSHTLHTDTQVQGNINVNYILHEC